MVEKVKKEIMVMTSIIKRTLVIIPKKNFNKNLEKFYEKKFKIEFFFFFFSKLKF